MAGSIDDRDGDDKQKKEKSRKPGSTIITIYSHTSIPQLTQSPTTRYRVPAAAIKGLAVSVLAPGAKGEYVQRRI